MTNELIKIALVDDHPFIIESLKQNFSLFAGVEVVFSAKNGLDLLQKLETHTMPQVVLMDLDMPVMNGVQAVVGLRERFSEQIKVVLLTVFDDEEKIFDAIKAGANGYLLKDEKPERIISAIMEVVDGGAPMSPGIAAKTLKMLRCGNFGQDHNVRENVSEKGLGEEFKLTAREVEIVQLIAEGGSYKKIADKLFISDKTVKKHIENIYKKLRISSKVEVVKLLQRYGS